MELATQTPQCLPIIDASMRENYTGYVDASVPHYSTGYKDATMPAEETG
jgi:hypothetical protein